jgi:acyl transferase domain-containing protein
VSGAGSIIVMGIEQNLPGGDSDAAIVAGKILILTPTQTIAQTEAGVLSPTGECRTFDASANGYARGEAINAILVQRLTDAVRQGTQSGASSDLQA